MRGLISASLLGLLLTSTVVGQSAPPPTFEVATIKPHAGECGGSMSRTSEGLISNGNSLGRLLEWAFQTKQIDLARVPEALQIQCFDIAGKATQRITGEQHWQMLQALLIERFHLTFHRESKEAPVYVLIRTKPSAKLGPGIIASADPDCPTAVAGPAYCAAVSVPSMLIGQRVPAARIARELSVFAGRPVLDRTGLTGYYDFKLSWTPDTAISDGDKLAGDKLKAPRPGLDQSGVSFFTAVEEQLGLKLQPQRGQIEILVIDHAEPPGEN